MNDNSLVELEVEKDGMRIRLKKASAPSENYSGPYMIEREKTAHPEVKDAPSAAKEKTSNTLEIKAPMVGTFYRSPSPEAPPYVEVGQIIEAMKLMNEIKSEVKGKLVEILVENTESVEFGQSMFIIEPL